MTKFSSGAREGACLTEPCLAKARPGRGGRTEQPTNSPGSWGTSPNNRFRTHAGAYSNLDAPVQALGALALRDPAEPGLRENAVYALRAIHTKETLPALVALLDHKEERVRPYALSGLCLFVRNAPPVTLQSVPSMSWLQSREPAPLLNPETQRFCLLGGRTGPAGDLDAYASFWKSWWVEHQIAIEKH